ncbi:MAG: hypothetical protein ABSG07_09560 [Terriglobales bacterium]
MSSFITSLSGLKQFVEGIKAGLPTSGALSDPFPGNFQAGGLRAYQMLTSVATALDQSGVFQHSEMPRDGRQRDAKGLG